MCRNIVTVENKLTRPEFCFFFLLLQILVTLSALQNKHLHQFFMLTYESPCTSSRISYNHLYHSKTLDFFIAYSPLAILIGLKFPWNFLSIFAHNMMVIRCSRFLFLIFRQQYNMNTHNFLYYSITNDWSAFQENESWNMFRRAQVQMFAWLITPVTPCVHSGN